MNVLSKNAPLLVNTLEQKPNNSGGIKKTAAELNVYIWHGIFVYIQEPEYIKCMKHINEIHMFF